MRSGVVAVGGNPPVGSRTVRLPHGATRAASFAELFLGCCTVGWLVVVVSFTLARAVPSRPLLALLALTMFAVLGCVLSLERVQPRRGDATAVPAGPGREPRAP